mmetsp:Transcript_97069/g.261065  ORF Transcript_97069/g.261065 Transcript_97069/m.261065 type:complete len:185 (+) Transcript_97069:108-662(+)
MNDVSPARPRHNLMLAPLGPTSGGRPPSKLVPLSPLGKSPEAKIVVAEGAEAQPASPGLESLGSEQPNKSTAGTIDRRAPSTEGAKQQAEHSGSEKSMMSKDSDSIESCGGDKPDVTPKDQPETEGHLAQTPATEPNGQVQPQPQQPEPDLRQQQPPPPLPPSGATGGGSSSSSSSKSSSNTLS